MVNRADIHNVPHLLVGPTDFSLIISPHVLSFSMHPSFPTPHIILFLLNEHPPRGRARHRVGMKNARPAMIELEPPRTQLAVVEAIPNLRVSLWVANNFRVRGWVVSNAQEEVGLEGETRWYALVEVALWGGRGITGATPSSCGWGRWFG
jgi:hypothetical protein